MADLARLDDVQLRNWLAHQRWYASKTREVSGIEILDQVAVNGGLVLAIGQANFATGTHELYQLPLALEPDTVLFDAIADPSHALALLARIEGGDELSTAEGRFSFRHVDRIPTLGARPTVRPVGAEQTNTSLVFGERLVMKLFRKLEAGINPELEMLRFLTAREFPNIAPLHGWYEYEGPSLAATLGVLQEFVPDAVDGWSLALDEIPNDPDRFLERAGELGTATASMHTVLASDPGDPAFSPEQPSNEAISLLTATIDEDIERIFLRLPDDERVAPIRGRGDDARERLAQRSQIGGGGKQIRIHGDFHLGQMLSSPRGWVILDFEGEPARPLPERRQKRSPLRDVASMLRSFAYATSAVELQRGQRAPEGFEEHAREQFLRHYFAAIDTTLLPHGESAIANLLAIFELEKAIYELRYELGHRPDWVPIPVAGIVRLLEGR